MYREFYEFYEVAQSVKAEHMYESARTAAAFDKIIQKYHIDAFWILLVGSQALYDRAACPVSPCGIRLAAMDIPGVTEGDIKTAMAMKILNLMGGGGMFLEFFSSDFDENFIMMGHDGPSNVSVAEGKPKLQNLTVHHGKTGKGWGLILI